MRSRRKPRPFWTNSEFLTASTPPTGPSGEPPPPAPKADVFITIAGLSAALPGFVASLSTKPVIGVPVSGKLNLDSILAIVQLPSGVPVGTVGLDNGTNAGLLAAQILALSDLEISKKLILYRSGQL